MLITKDSNLKMFNLFKSFIKELNDKNLKKIKSSSKYYLKNGTIVAMGDTGTIDMYNTYGKINITRKRFSDGEFVSIINSICALIDGAELFRFLKEYNTKIESFEITNNSLIIRTDSEDEVYTSIDIKQVALEVNALSKFIKEEKETFTIDRTEDGMFLIDKWDSLKNNMTEVCGIKIINNKRFVVINKPEAIKVSLMNHKDFDELKLVKFTMSNDLITLYHAFKVIDY